MTFEELQFIVESNARSLQALGDHISELTHDVNTLVETSRQAQEERHELREATLGIANLLVRLDETQPTILRKLNSIERKVDQLLDRDEDLS